MNLTELSKIVHKANEKWWQDIDTGERFSRNKGELLCLIHSEISEAMEGERKSGKEPCPHCKVFETSYKGLCMDDGPIWYCANCDREHIGPVPNQVVLMDDKLPQYPMAAVEIVDAMIRCLDYLAGMHPDIDVQQVFDDKMAYNATREDHKHEARRIAGGKQF